MTDALVRWGWPNSVAIVALAMIPLVSVVTMSREDAHASPIVSATSTFADEVDVASAEGRSE